MKKISIVTPCYNEEANILNHFEQVNKTLQPYKDRFVFEHIYTDNNSEDSTFEILEKLGRQHPEVKAIRFSRNIGANKSIYTGLSKATGDAVILIQADLQDPPEIISQFIDNWLHGYDIVFGKIAERDEVWILKNMRKIYYWIIAQLSDVPIAQNAGEFRLMSRRALDALMQFPEEDLYIRGAVGLIGFRQKPISYHRQRRVAGKSSINFLGLISYGINGLLSTTVVPLRLVTIFGFVLAFLGFIMIFVLIILKIIDPSSAPRGLTSISILIVFFSGIQILSLGVIGEYIRKIYIQSLHRPRGFIQDKVNLD